MWLFRRTGLEGTWPWEGRASQTGETTWAEAGSGKTQELDKKVENLACSQYRALEGQPFNNSCY